MGAVGIYARISLDRRDGEGVARQLADCRELVTARWPDAQIAEYVDNDLSAFRAKRRPEYERLLADLADRNLTAVVAYHSDRLYRRLTDLETFIDAVQAAGADVATVKAGDIDLSTASGRMLAGILGAVVKHESERISERVARAKKQRVAEGRPGGGGRRAYGFTVDRTALVPEEADVLRDAAASVIAGESWNSVVRRLDDDGVRNGSGGLWTVGNLVRTLTSPHVAGLSIYQGTVVAAARWPAILDRETWELLSAEAKSRRRGRPPSERHMLTGLLACWRCGRALFTNTNRRGQRTYECRRMASSSGRGCGRLGILAGMAEDHVRDTVRGWLRRPSFVAELNAYLAYGDHDLADVRAELDDVKRRELLAGRQWASGAMPDEVHADIAAVLAGRRRELEARLDGVDFRPRLRVRAEDMARACDAFDTGEWRETIRLVARTPIVVGPGLDDRRLRIPVDIRLSSLRPVWED